MAIVLDDLELATGLDPGPQNARRQELGKKTHTPTLQREGPGGSIGRDLRVENGSDPFVALLLLLTWGLD